MKTENNCNQEDDRVEFPHSSHKYVETSDTPLIMLTRGMILGNLLNKVFVELDEGIDLLHILENEFCQLEGGKKKENTELMNALRCFYFDDNENRCNDLYPYRNYIETIGYYYPQLHGGIPMEDSPVPPQDGTMEIQPMFHSSVLMLMELGRHFVYGNPVGTPSHHCERTEWSFLRDQPLENYRFVEGKDLDSLQRIPWDEVDVGERNWALFPRMVLRFERFLDLYKGGIDKNHLFRDVYDNRTVWSWSDSWIATDDYAQVVKESSIKGFGGEKSQERTDYWIQQMEKYYDADVGMCSDCWLKKHYPELLPDEDTLDTLLQEVVVDDDASVVAILNTHPESWSDITHSRLCKHTLFSANEQTMVF